MSSAHAARSGEAMLERLNNSRSAQVTSLRKAGLTYAEIGRKLGLTRERVRQIAKAEKKAKKKPARDDPDALLTTTEAAELLNIHVNTVRRWSNKGILETYRIGSRGDRRLRRGDVDKLLRKTQPADTTNHMTMMSR
jgi:excisionase family DNA binding protein